MEMGVRNVLRRAVLGNGPGHEPFECRRCGVSIGQPCEECPVCGAPDVVTIEV